jgi:predicted chitinase
MNGCGSVELRLDYEALTESLFKGSLPKFQKRPMDLFLEEYTRRVLDNQNLSPEQLAYILATAYHESGRFRFNKEIGKGRGRDYGKPTLVIRGKTETYYGRGWVQITWLQNYAKLSIAASRAFNRTINFVENPDEIFKNDRYNTFVIFEGMLSGMFTGKKLDHYVHHDKVDFRGARKVVNGTDKDTLIAGYAEVFLAAME